MSRFGKRSSALFRSAASRAAVLLLTLLGWAQAADTVLLKDGSKLEGQVVTLDSQQLTLQLIDGTKQRIPRGSLQSVEFGETESAPIVARVHVGDGDDLVNLFLDGTPIASAAELKAGWVDIGAKLKEGANLISGEVQNEVGVWAYRWTLVVGREQHTFSCGLAQKSGCKRDGAKGTEKGNQAAGRAWIYLHRADGELRLQVESE